MNNFTGLVKRTKLPEKYISKQAKYFKSKKERKMSKYKFDGKNLKDGGKIIANISGNNIRNGSGGSVIGNIRGDSIRKGSGGTVLFNIKGDDIRTGSGGSKIATMKDVNNSIDGPGKVLKAALWLLCCR
jgi:hypothetical protein